MLNGRVSICCTGTCPFTAACMNERLHLGLALTDHTSKGRMRDSYALQIFTLENFLNLVHSDALNMAFFILPYALWNNVINNPGMSCQMRREFLAVCLDIFAMFSSMMKDVNTSVVSINKTKNELVQFACSDNHCRRALNTLIVQLVEIGRHPDDLAMDRLGTHPLECCFGMIRLLCSNKHNWKHVLLLLLLLLCLAALRAAHFMLAFAARRSFSWHSCLFFKVFQGVTSVTSCVTGWFF